MTIASAVDRIEIGDHVVQFYEREQDLVAGVSRYLCAAVEAGGVVIVIARPARSCRLPRRTHRRWRGRGGGSRRRPVPGVRRCRDAGAIQQRRER